MILPDILIKNKEKFKKIFYSQLDVDFPNGWRYHKNEDTQLNIGYISISSTPAWTRALIISFIKCGLTELITYYNHTQREEFDWTLEEILDGR